MAAPVEDTVSTYSRDDYAPSQVASYAPSQADSTRYTYGVPRQSAEVDYEQQPSVESHSYRPSVSTEGTPLRSNQDEESTARENVIYAQPLEDYVEHEHSKHEHNVHHRIRVGVMIFAVFSMLVQLVVIVVPHWWVAHSYSQGLWMRCSYHAQWMNCVETDFELTDFLIAARVLEVVAGIIYFAAMVCAILHVAVYKRSFWIKAFLAGGIALAALFAFVGAVAFIGKVKETNRQSTPGASFILAIINTALSWAFAVAACLNFKKF